MDKPNFQSKTESDVKVINLSEGFFQVVVVSSDGCDIAVDIPLWLEPHLNREILERTLACVEDAFYRVRPDLRKQ